MIKNWLAIVYSIEYSYDSKNNMIVLVSFLLCKLTDITLDKLWEELEL